MTKIKVDEVEVVAPDNSIRLETTIPNATVDVTESITAEIEPDNYVIASTGYSAGIPGWISDTISNIVKDSIGTGGSLEDALLSLRDDLMDQIQLGVHQAMSKIENEYISQSTFTTTLASEIGNSRSAILESVQTYADATQTYATDVTALKSSFGGDTDADAIEAFIGNIALTKATSKEAFAATTEVLTASYNGLEPRITTTEEVVAGQFKEWTEGEEPKIGMFKIEDGSYWNYVGGTLGENNDGWLRTDENALSVADQASSWAAGASKLITSPDGSITGWEFGDSSGSKSEFKINAENFSISNGSTGYKPFSISGSNVQFNGRVNFSNTDMSAYDNSNVNTDDLAKKDMSNVTTIDGGKITTGTIDANRIDVGSINMSDLSGSIDWGSRVSNKPTIPSKMSELNNDSNYVDASYSGFTHIDANGIYTGTLSADNINAGTLNAVRMSTDSLKVVTPQGYTAPFSVSLSTEVTLTGDGEQSEYSSILRFSPPGKTSGYLANRLVSVTSPREIMAFKSAANRESRISILRRIDDGNWTEVRGGQIRGGGDTLLFVDTDPFTDNVDYKVRLWADDGNSYTVRGGITAKGSNFQ